VTVLQRLDLADRITLDRAERLAVNGFRDDTLVRDALVRFAGAAGVDPRWRAHIEKRIPVAAGLGGGSSDAATALALANKTLPRPLDAEALHDLAAGLGADVPFFLHPGPALATGVGTELSTLELPQDYWVVVVLPKGVAKRSTAEVYAAYDERGGEQGFAERRTALLEALAEVGRPRDLAKLPANDLASSPIADELLAHGAFRADVTGAGPAVYGLFMQRAAAERAALALRPRGRTWVTVPAWYG
jgi:4-diphosphocytidyl-2-C-methyl-D-erythritol kinase